MTENIKKSKLKKIENAINTIVMVLMGLCLFSFFSNTIKLELAFPPYTDRVLLILLNVIALIKIGVLTALHRDNLKQWLKWAVFSLIICADYWATYYYNGLSLGFLLVLGALTLATMGIDYTVLVKEYCIIIGILLSSVILLAWVGAAENLVYLKDSTIRSAWGIGYPTDLAAYFIYLSMFWWVADRKHKDTFFLFPGLVSLIISIYVAYSITGIISAILFILSVCIHTLASDNRYERLRINLDKALPYAFPVLALVMILLLWAYSKDTSIAIKINSLMTGRLKLAYDAFKEYGLTPFGSPLEQIGGGGSTFWNPNYNFVDIGYLLILLRYGYVSLIMIATLWVMMTRKAIRIGDRRLALVLCLICFHSVSEHHFTEIIYNIILAMPFAVLLTDEKKVAATEEKSTLTSVKVQPFKEILKNRTRLKGKEKKIAIKLIAITITFLLVYIALPLMLKKARTVITLTGVSAGASARWLLMIASASLILLIVVTGAAIHKIISTRLADNRWNKSMLIVCAVFIAVNVGISTVCNSILSSEIKNYKDDLEYERSAIELIKENKRGKLYAYGLPGIYGKAFGSISSSVMDGEELAGNKDTTVIMNSSYDSKVFFTLGYLYTRISDNHSIYTNDNAVIDSMKKDGYIFTGYWPVEETVSIKEMAYYNGLEQEHDGSVILKGSDKAFWGGPYIDLRAGQYTIKYECEVSAKDIKKYQPGDWAYVMRVLTGENNKCIKEKVATYGSFTENHKTKTEIICNIPDSKAVTFQIVPYDNKEIIVHNISYQKTPDYDTHFTINNRGLRTYEEYYDYDGNPLTLASGYFARDLHYDMRHNVNHEIYYDTEKSKALNTRGYCEVSREYNKDNQLIREEYFGLDGKPCLCTDGYAIVTLTRDDAGNVTSQCYYDTENNLTINSWGYARIDKEYDIGNKVVKETYYDDNDQITSLAGGQAYVSYVYDEKGHQIEVHYYDASGDPIMIWGCYHIAKKEFNEEGKVAREKYYNVRGQWVNRPDGYASTEFKYDDAGNTVEIRYYDISGAPVKVRGLYSGINRIYDDKNRIIREEYISVDGTLAVNDDGVAYKIFLYDNKTGNTKQLWYDNDDKEMDIIT